ncbi:MAG: RnfABCDGE type electron transport complex subunit G [Bacillota bacterium]
MRDYVRLTGILLIICLIAAVLLGLTNSITHDKIQEQIAKANDEARAEVLPAAREFNKVEYSNPNLTTVVEVYEGKTDGNLTGYAVKVAPKGYGGLIEIIVGIDTNGVVQGIKVGNNNETPGLGKNAASPGYQNQYKGKTIDNEISVIKNGTPKENEIVAIAGSTITSKGVTNGVNEAMAAVKELLNK